MEEYKILKLNSEEIDILKIAVISQIVDLKIKKDKSKEKEELLDLDTKMSKYQHLLSILMFIER